MAAIFHTPMLINGLGANWKSLPALDAGIDPMRRVILKASTTAATRVANPFRVGVCSAGQATENAGQIYVDSAGSMDLGVVNYNSITVRANDGGAATDHAYIYVISYAITDEGPKGVS